MRLRRECNDSSSCATAAYTSFEPRHRPFVAADAVGRACRVEFLAAAALAGNLIAQHLPALPARPLAALALAAGFAMLFRRVSMLAGVGLMAFGLTALVADGRLADRFAAAQADVEIEGWIDTVPATDGNRTVFTLRSGSEARARGVPRRIRLSWYDSTVALEAGASVAVTARIRPPRGLVNPGGFDYERWLLTEDIGATGYVREGQLVSDRRYGLAQSWLRKRAELARSVDAAIGDGTAGALIAALAFGMRDGFDDGHWDVLRRTGTTHLVAISGLHVGLVAAAAFRCLLWLALRLPLRIAVQAWPLAAMLALVCATAYAGLAGFALPTVRALLMLAVVQAVVVSRRRIAPLSGLAFALLIVLVFDPLATLAASFWLSFAAVAVIVVFVTSSRQPEDPNVRGSRFLSAAIALVSIQCVVGLGLLPITAVVFGEVSIAGFAVNLVAVPFFSFVLVPLSLAIAAAAATGVGTAAIAALAAPLATAVWRVLVAVAGWPHAAISLPQVGLSAMLVALAGLAAVLALRSRLRWIGLVAFVPLALGGPERPASGSFTMTVLDVGHGLAVVVRTATHTLLYDTGPVTRSGFDAGASIVVPALSALSPDALNMIVVSHGDSDHAGGLAAVRSAHDGARLLAGPDLSGGTVERCEAGSSWHWDGVDFTVLHPLAGAEASGNDSSCVIRIDAPGGSVLLTGDIERRAERTIADAMLRPVDVVVAPHHGSATSSSEAFVRATRPRVVIASAAYGSRWGFPRPDVVARWLSVGARVLTTGDSGAVTSEISDSGLRVRRWRNARSRYWVADSGTGHGSAL